MGRPGTSTRAVAILAAVIAAFAAAAASATAAPLAYTTNLSATSTVSVIDTATNEVIGKPIPVGGNPEAMAVTPNGKTAYVTNDSSGSVSVIDTATATNVKTISVGTRPTGVAISPDGSTVYVSDFESERVSIISTASNTVVGELKVKGEPGAPAVTPDGKFVWVPRKGASGGAIEIFDAQTRQPVGTVEIPEESFGLVFTPDGSKALIIVEEAQSEVWVINTALRQPVKKIPGGNRPIAIAISPDGRTAYVSIANEAAIWKIDTASNEKVGSIPVPGPALGQIAITPDGKKAYVASATGDEVFVVNLVTGQKEAKALTLPGEPRALVVAPDQSPTAAFAAPSATAGLSAFFNGTASTDPDGNIAAWNWTFGDGGTASGPSVTHTFAAPGIFPAKLSVVDNEGCGEAQVFTGQTAYCSGNVAAAATHAVTVTAPPIVCSAGRFVVGRIVHNRRNGTARVQVKVPENGSIFLFGKKVHAVTKKSVRAGTTWLTLHARVKLNKRLKKVHRAPVRIRVNFFPSGSCGSPANVHRTLALIRAPQKKHHKG